LAAGERESPSGRDATGRYVFMGMPFALAESIDQFRGDQVCGLEHGLGAVDVT